MKPLVMNQRVLSWLCLLPDDGNISKWKKLACIALVLGLMMVPLTIFPSSIVYAVKFMSINPLESLFGFYQSIGSIPMANAIIMTFIFRSKIPPIFEKLSHFYEKCMNRLIFVVLNYICVLPN